MKIKSDKQHSSHLPLWLKLTYTISVVLLASVYLMEYGIENFLWGSDIALLVTVFGLWLENRFLISMMLIGILLPEFFWNIDFFSQLIAGYDMFGLNLTAYMFDPNRLFLLLYPLLLSLPTHLVLNYFFKNKK